MTIGMPANETFEPVTIVNEEGSGPFVLVCDHASNFMPESYGHLGLSSEDLQAHISWDPGALGVSLQLSQLMDAPLIYSNVSRLIIDCNRETVAPDLIPCRSELTDIPGNADLDADERKRRIALAHTPFHDAIDRLIDIRQSKGVSSALVSVHSYTPIYKGETRPWEIGLIYGDDASLAKPALQLLKDRTSYTVGDNEPYSPADGVYYTLHRHGEARGLVPLMIEIRNDEITTQDAEAAWATTLAPILTDALAQAGGK
ncbi:N-formylglutamate amidohydrolase [Roseibium polysiphoniae]|nr:N-formylglutamate amidohydrolase [Roseibium polysiphoniae]